MTNPTYGWSRMVESTALRFAMMVATDPEWLSPMTTWSGQALCGVVVALI